MCWRRVWNQASSSRKCYSRGLYTLLPSPPSHFRTNIRWGRTGIYPHLPSSQCYKRIPDMLIRTARLFAHYSLRTCSQTKWECAYSRQAPLHTRAESPWYSHDKRLHKRTEPSSLSRLSKNTVPMHDRVPASSLKAVLQLPHVLLSWVVHSAPVTAMPLSHEHMLGSHLPPTTLLPASQVVSTQSFPTFVSSAVQIFTSLGTGSNVKITDYGSICWVEVSRADMWVRVLHIGHVGRCWLAIT